VAVIVRIPASLRGLVGGAGALHIDGVTTVAAVLDRLAAEHPALERRLRDEQGALRPHVNVFIGSDNIRDLAGLATSVADGAELTVLPAVSGGR
jgi:molybdopterin converting factor small subunit